MHIEYEDFNAKHGLPPRWRGKGQHFPRGVSLESRPLRGKLRSWLEGVDRPVRMTSSPPVISRESFMNDSKHYRTERGTVSVSGVFLDMLKPSEDNRVSDLVELEALYQSHIADARKEEVRLQDAAYLSYPSASDLTGDSPISGEFITFNCFWEVEGEAVEDSAERLTIRFKPTVLAQLRHFFRLKPWTYTMFALPATL